MASNELLTEQFYFCNTMPRTNLAVRVASAVFRIAGEMCWLPAYFDNPDGDNNNNNNNNNNELYLKCTIIDQID